VIQLATTTLLVLAEAAGDKDVPVFILLPLAFIIPLGVLLGFSFLTRRRGGGH
jgi:hypothetical protein